MCGISGLYGFKNKNEAEILVKTMNDSLAHRGPDASGIWSNDAVVLGHRRLSIIDTSADGNQPFISTDEDVVLVFNGELYNYLEIKEELRSKYSFKTGSDTEVVIAAYQTWGMNCLDHFIGMFAFALWDSHKKTLFVVRDRLGIKPLYYAEGKKEFAFASEIRAVLKTGIVPRKISSQGLSDYLQYQTVHAPNTIIEGIQMLMPGHYLEIDTAGIQNHKYWGVVENAKLDVATHTKTEIKKNIRSIMESSIALRMRSDVPFGSFLSGGIDSSIITGLMSQIASQRVNTFSVTFFEKQFDESSYSSLIAKKFNTVHHEMRVSSNDFLNELPDALSAMDHPSGDGPNTYVVSKMTRKAGVKMALSGLGGDELFAGYDVFTRMSRIENAKWLSAMPKSIRGLSGRVLHSVKPSIASQKISELLNLTDLDFANLYPITRQSLSQDIVKGLIRTNPSQANMKTLMGKIASTNLPLLSKVSAAEICTYMQNVLLRDTDQMSMAHALEVRVPFLDHRLVEYMLGVPDNIKYPNTPKQLLVESFADLLPPEIVNRKKMGFTFPWSNWLKTELKSFCETNLASLENLSCVNAPEVQKLWQRFLQNDPLISWSRVWHLVVLGYWTSANNVSE